MSSPNWKHTKHRMKTRRERRKVLVNNQSPKNPKTRLRQIYTKLVLHELFVIDNFFKKKIVLVSITASSIDTTVDLSVVQYASTVLDLSIVGCYMCTRNTAVPVSIGVLGTSDFVSANSYPHKPSQRPCGTHLIHSLGIHQFLPVWRHQNNDSEYISTCL